MHDAHLDESILRAHLDGELPWADAMRCSLHLRHCALCRETLDEARRLDAHAAALLARVAADARIPTRPRWRPGRRPAVWTVGALAIGLLVGVLLPRLGGPGERLVADGVKDVCCWNLDGGPHGDDGVFTVSAAGERVDCVVLYDDADHSHHLSHGDHIRFATPAPRCPSRVVGALHRAGGEPPPGIGAGPATVALGE